MTTTSTAHESEIVKRFRAAGQGQVFRFLDLLGPDERGRLFEQAEGIDLDLIERLNRGADVAESQRPHLEPMEAMGPDHPRFSEATRRGHELFRQGKVAFYMVAGGQGSRLGFEGPKGSFPVGPFSGKTLFHWQAEKVLAASRRYARAILLVVLVSETNAEETERIFAENAWFGLEGRVHLVRQRMLPAVDSSGRILLSSPGEIMLSPNGHGGSIAALADGGAVEWLSGAGVEFVSYFQVDNPLLNAADPAFLGFLDLLGAEMSAKVVRKRKPEDREGVVALLDGRPGVVEYTEISPEDASARSEDGTLLYDLASIAAHGFALSFLDRIHSVGLPWHTARKSIPSVDDDGRPVKVKGRKYETFVFDAIPLAREFFAFLTNRAEDFAPLKNSEGAHSPATVRAAILDRTRSWYERAGSAPPEDDQRLELSPLSAYDYETFLAWLKRLEGGGTT